MNRRKVILSIVLLQAAWAQGIPFSGPVEGMTFDAPARSFRAIRGWLGSASLGPALGPEFETGFAAPRKDFGLAFDKQKLILVSGLSAGEPALSEIGGASLPEAAAWPADASCAVLYSRKENWIQIVRDLPASPKLDAPFSLAPFGPLSAVAVQARCGEIMLAVGGEHAGILRLAGGNFEPVLSIAQPSALSYSEAGDRLYILNGALHCTSLNLTDLSQETFALPGLAHPVAIRAVQEAGGRRLLYAAGFADAERTAPLLAVFDAETRDLLESSELSFAPSSIEPLGRASFSLRGRSSQDDPLWSFVNAGALRVFFVPGGLR